MNNTRNNNDTGKDSCQVFLGGSCNPTTWRKCIAIPYLEKHGVTYYNPQVDEWYPELMDIEEQAKLKADVLLFVVDNRTRAVASMVEASYFAASGRNVVTVVHFIDSESPTIAGDALSEGEINDLNRGRLFVGDIFHSTKAPHFKSLDQALEFIVQMVCTDVNISHFVCPSCECTVASIKSLPDETSLIHGVFDMYDSEGKKQLSLSEAEKALIILLNVPRLPKPLLQTRELALCDCDNVLVECSQFCELYRELKSVNCKLTNAITAATTTNTTVKTTPVLPWQQYLWSLLVGIIWWPYNVLTTFWSHEKAPEAMDQANSKESWYDVFLGGTCASSTWRQDTAIPLLKEHQISYFNPHVTNWNEALIPYEARAKEKCHILLYVITGHSTSVGSLVEVSYYLGTDQQVVLCIQDINNREPHLAHLSNRAMHDYNRGRSYLKDAAMRKSLTVFNTVEDAIMEVIRLNKNLK